jgi:hypothetical protein
LFVGGLQVVIPTVLLIQSNGDPARVLAASGLYPFGFTYLYVGLNLLTGTDGTGAGWYSLFVAVSAVGFPVVNFVKLEDGPFGVIWLSWAFLWFLFFLLLARIFRSHDHVARRRGSRPAWAKTGIGV